MPKQPVFKNGSEIADHIEPHDRRLADLIRAEEEVHGLAQTNPNSYLATTTFVNAVGLPGRYQDRRYAQAILKRACPDMPPEQVAIEVDVRMARAKRYKKDPSQIFVTERVLGLKIPYAKVCWGSLLKLAESSEHNISCRVLPDAAIDDNWGELGMLREGALVMPGANAFYSEPDNRVVTLEDARYLAQSANNYAFDVEESLHLIKQRIA